MMEKRTVGAVLSVRTQWWLKVNTKPVKTHMMDGATFPHIVKVKYTVGNLEFVRRKWLWAGMRYPQMGDRVTVIYREDKPTKFRLEI